MREKAFTTHASLWCVMSELYWFADWQLYIIKYIIWLDVNQERQSTRWSPHKRLFFFSGVSCTCALIPYVFNWKFSKASEIAPTCFTEIFAITGTERRIKNNEIKPPKHWNYTPAQVFWSTPSQSCPDNM